MQNEIKKNIDENTRESSSSITILEFLNLLWRKKFVLVLFVAVAALLGAGYAMWLRPQYTSDALLQVNVKGSSSKATKAMGEMGAVLDLASPADAEIELIKSRMVLSYVVAAEHLYLWTQPVGFWDRLMHTEGRLDLDSLHIPKQKAAQKWYAVATGEDSYSLLDSKGSSVLKGKVGEVLTKEYAGDTLSIRVSYMDARVGQKFLLLHASPMAAERVLQGSLQVMEKGKQTGIAANAHFRAVQAVEADGRGRLASCMAFSLRSWLRK